MSRLRIMFLPLTCAMVLMMSLMLVGSSNLSATISPSTLYPADFPDFGIAAVTDERLREMDRKSLFGSSLSVLICAPSFSSVMILALLTRLFVLKSRTSIANFHPSETMALSTALSSPKDATAGPTTMGLIVPFWFSNLDSSLL